MASIEVSPRDMKVGDVMEDGFTARENLGADFRNLHGWRGWNKNGTHGRRDLKVTGTYTVERASLDEERTTT